MLLSATDFLVTGALLVLGIFLYKGTTRSSRRLRLPYPPGPSRLPLIGNLLDFPTSSEAFNAWCKKLDSDLLYLRAFGNEFLILNSMEAIEDLLEKRSSIYSSRPTLPMIDLMGWSWMFSVLPYGDMWRERRRTFTKYFHPGSTAVHQPYAIQFVRSMLPRLLDHPEDFLEISRHSVTAFTISLAYGFPIREKDDPYVSLAERALSSINEASLPGSFLVNILPVLRHVPEWMPGAEFKRKARAWKKTQEQFRIVPFERTIKDMSNGIARPSFVTSNMSRLNENVSSQEIYQREVVIADTAAMIFEAATDTTLAAVKLFFAAMLCYPEVQKRAQAEVDRVLRGRLLPEFTDEDDMPYVGAVIKELLRWKPIAPLAVPHSTTQDDVYRGFRIPKGVYVLANSWALLQDEDHFPNPTEFIPERFLHEDGVTPRSMGAWDPRRIAFGYGRRTCPGSHVAVSYLWMTVASVLSMFDISRERDEDGNELPPDVEFHTGVVCEALPFKCTISPRSSMAVTVIRGLEKEEVS
ncbi:cytochrome P450 [Agrocybe pediades]|nr:cytochrome P450 [Agrocybe pediades]